MNYKIFSLGDGAVTIDFGNEISVEFNNRVLNLARFFEENPFDGFVETVPAYSSLTVFYDVYKVRKNSTEFAAAYEAVADLIKIALENQKLPLKIQPNRIEMPVCFDAEFAPDLDSVAAENNLSRRKVIEIFLARTYRVFMIGFLPGFSYMGKVDKKISAPRKQMPRARVAAGSVGIAGRQTGIYSLASPGGWQIIGRTPIELFTPKAEKPTALAPGDAVKFYEIGKKGFLKLKSETQ